MIRVLLYADINLNVMDGSAIWLQSIAKFLATYGGQCQVHLVLKQALQRSIGEQLDTTAIPNLQIIAPPGDAAWNISAATKVIAGLDRDYQFDAVITRGVRACHSLVETMNLEGRLVAYLTDLPQRYMPPSSPEWQRVDQILRTSQFVICQTEAFRDYFELQWPSSCGKCYLLPPMIPAAFFEAGAGRDYLGRRPLRIIYTGQIDKRWGMSMFMALRGETARRQLPVEYVVIGDKINAASDDPEFKTGVQEFLASGDDVVAHPAMARDTVREHILSCSLGFCLRERVMDERFEISTKLLEYCATGLPVLLNRTAANVALLGPDYPLYVNDTREAVAAVGRVFQEPDLLKDASQRVRAAVEDFRIERSAERFRPVFELLHRRADARENPRYDRLLVASHDWKFFAPVRDGIEGAVSARVDTDHWNSLTDHDESTSLRLLKRANTVFCEWCAGNAVWYSRNVRPDQRLFIRFHRFEITTPFPEQVQIDRVTRVIFVSEYLRAEACAKFDWPIEKTAVIPNSVDCAQFRRTKTENSRLNLGMIGILPKLKRLDLALDLTQRLLERDPRYRLFIRGRLPWDLQWLWSNAEQREYFEQCMDRLRDSDLLRRAVVFDGFGPDIPRWLTKIGFVLSLSDVESFHLAAAEGLASGAAPLILRRKGAEEIFPKEFVFDSVSQITDYILEGPWEMHGDTVRRRQQWIAERYDERVVGPLWRDLVRA